MLHGVSLRRRLQITSSVVSVALLGMSGLAGCGPSGATGAPSATWDSVPIEDNREALLVSPSPWATPSPTVTPSPTPVKKPSVSPKPTPTKKVTATATATANQCVTPKHSTFTVASGGSGVLGSAGHLYRYEVLVENGIGQSTAAFAKAVDATLGGKLGWTDSGTRRFQRVSDGACDFVVELASAATSTKICADYGLNTEGKVSCRGGREVVINLDRWLTGDPDPAWTGHLDVYRNLVVDHEVGHFLGYHHMACPGAGQPLPVMATPYTTGLEGCVINGWPYAPDGTFITGPAQPGN